MRRRDALLTLAAAGLSAGWARASDRIAGPDFATRSPVYAPHGAAATAHPLATNAALDVLKAGGSAVDAAIAANAALGFLEPTGCGIGGDLFALVWDPKEKRLFALNATGRSPQGLSLADRTAREAAMRAKIGRRPQLGSVTVSVPGAVDGWFALHRRFGALGMGAVLAPAIGLAEEGAPTPPVIAEYFRRGLNRFRDRHAAGEIEEIANALALYFPGDAAPRTGALRRNTDLARTYRLLVSGGRDAFYEGPVAQTVDAYMRRIGGPLRAADLAANRPDWVEPISTRYRGHDVWQIPPNSQGLSTLQMLAILDGFDMKGAGFNTALSIHLQAEAKRLAFADRARLIADPAFAPTDVARLLSADYIAARRALINPDRANPALDAGAPAAPDGRDTTYLAVADRNGMMVSLIQSNYRGMGSGLVPDGLGFMLHNRGEAFSLDPKAANAYAPGKRPFHTIIPGFVTRDGAPFMAFGVMGGAMQPQGQTQVLVNMLDHGLDVQSAGDAPRWRHDGGCEPEGDCRPGLGTLYLERGVGAETRAGLEARGWTLGASDGGFGGYQAVMRDPASGVYAAASESRTDGQAGGY